MGIRQCAVLAVLGPLLVLSGCGEESATDRAEAAVEEVTGERGVELKGNSRLDAAAYGLVSAQSSKYSDYEIDGSTVRITVRDGVTLNGSECMIVNAATEVDYPDATFVLVTPDGEETTC